MPRFVVLTQPANRFAARAWAVCLTATGLLTGTSAYSEAVPIPNGDLDLRGQVAQDEPANIARWAAAGEDDHRPAAWFAADPAGWSVELTANTTLSQKFTIPALPEGRDAANWYGLVGLDTLGAGDGRGRAGYSLELIDTATGQRIAREAGFVDGSASPNRRVTWSASTNSENLGPTENTPATNAIDANPNTIWHTQWEGASPQGPHHLDLDLGIAHRITAVTYLPRQDRTNAGNISDYAVYLSSDGENWGSAVAEGSFDYDTHGKRVQTITIRYPRNARFVRLEARSEVEGRAFASAAEVDVVVDRAANAQDASIERGWLYLSPEEMAQIAGKEVELRLTGLTERGVVVDSVNFCRLHTLPTRQLQAKPNGVNGPDFLDAGALGFTALTEHQHAPLTVIGVTENGPADAAHLRPGDCIIEVGRVPLRKTSCAPGWQWANNGHEATLGRAVEAALADGLPRSRENTVELTVLRLGERARVRIRIPDADPFAETFPFDDPKALEMYADIVAWVAGAQRSDGSWDRDPKRTCLGALTLLGTHDAQYAGQIKAAMDWMINRHPEPNAFGNLGYWGASYGGILAAEYYLATGDNRVLPWMERILVWAHNGHHNSAWDLPTLGHGPGGLPYGNKALVAPAVHLLVFEALAERCGIDSPLYDLIMPTLEHAWSNPADGGHGALGYNASYKDLGEFFSRTGLFALALTLRDDHPEMRGPLADIMRERYPWLRNSHAYGEPGGALGLIGLSQADPDAFAHVMRELRWTFALAWEPGHGLHFTQPHMGAPYMGEQQIINPAYGALFSVINQGLHITGSTQRNWLDVSGIPTTLTPVAIRRNREGVVSLACRVPGPTIRYTLDGSPPDAESMVYEGPFELPVGGMVRALAFDEAGTPGELADAIFGLAKAHWSIVEATGAPTTEQASARATAAIDGDPGIPWMTDVGKAAVVYPHHIVIDLGQRTPVTAIQLQFQGKDQSPAELSAYLSDDATNFGDASASETYAEYEAQRNVSLDTPAWGRYVRIEMATALSARPMLIVAELDVQSVVPEIEENGNSVTLSAPEGFTIRYTTDGSPPTAQSPAYENPIDLSADQPLLARCFAEGFAGAIVVLHRE